MWERYNMAGQQCMSQGKWTDAETQFKLAVQEAEKMNMLDTKLPLSLQNLANCYRQQGRFSEAEPHYKRAIELKEKSSGPLHSDMVPFLENYAKMLRASGREKEAEKMDQKARAIFARS